MQRFYAYMSLSTFYSRFWYVFLVSSVIVLASAAFARFAITPMYNMISWGHHKSEQNGRLDALVKAFSPGRTKPVSKECHEDYYVQRYREEPFSGIHYYK